MNERMIYLSNFMRKGIHVPSQGELAGLDYIASARRYEAIVCNVKTEIELIKNDVEYAYDRDCNYFLIKGANDEGFVFWAKLGKWRGFNKQNIYSSRGIKDFLVRFARIKLKDNELVYEI